MKLPFSLPFQKPEKTEFFLALLLRDEKATAVIFEEIKGRVHVVGEHEVMFDGSIESSSQEEWLEVIDKAISAAESTLPKSIQTHKTIFGVKSDWVEDAKIKHEYLSKLKKISDELALTPIGFLVISEAIAHLLTEEEGAPVSAILLEIGKNIITASLFRAGRIIETRSADIDGSLVDTADKLLHKFPAEVLPSRLIVFNSKENEVIAQEFMSHSWSRSIPFLHVPKVVPLPKGFDAKAVLFGAASQMGFEVLESMPRIMPEPTAVVEKTTHMSSEPDFGFVMDKDIAESDGMESEKTASNAADAKGSEETVEELEEDSPKEYHDGEEGKEKEDDKEDGDDNDDEEDEGREIIVHGGDSNGKRGMQKIGNIFRHFKLPRFGNKRKIVFVPPVILAVIILLFVGYVFLLKASVVLHVTPKEVSKEQDIVFSTIEPTNLEKNIIEARSVTVSLDGTLSTSVTGKKETGDKAKGSVTLYSRLASSKTIAQGTVLTGPNDLEFTLDKAVSLASSSADASASPSTATIAVTAKDIGKESNLPSGAKFSVDGYDIGDLVAKNDGAFAGGTKKEISIVSQDDLDKLVSELPKNLEEKAKDSSSAKVSGDEVILPVLVNTIVDKKSFDKKVGQEANSVTLTATVTFEEMSYKKDVIDAYSKNLLKDDIHDMEIAKDGISSKLEQVKRKGADDVGARFSLVARLVPKIDVGKIANAISGKSFDDARRIVAETPQVASAEISLVPPLPLLPNLLPRLAQNITVTVANNE